MITLNGKKFVSSRKCIVDTLFKKGGTCVGYYKLNRKTIALFNVKNERIGVITCDNVLARATPTSKDNWWYSHCTIPEIGEFSTYAHQQEDIRNALSLLEKSNQK